LIIDRGLSSVEAISSARGRHSEYGRHWRPDCREFSSWLSRVSLRVVSGCIFMIPILTASKSGRLQKGISGSDHANTLNRRSPTAYPDLA